MSFLRPARCPVPRDLDEVTTVGEEVRPRELGISGRAVRRIWAWVRSLYSSGFHPAIQLCLRYRGEVVLDRAIGYARGNGPEDGPDAPKVLATPRTPFTIFSASKAVTAMAIHLLDQRNLIRLDDPVCEYIPEFGTRNKEWITIRHVLSHRAGIPNVPPEAVDLDLLADPEAILDFLCRSRPVWRPGRFLAYHAITGGFLLAEVVRRVTGRTIRSFVDREIRKPLGFRWMNYGVRPGQVREVALNYVTGYPPLPPLSSLLRRAMGLDFEEAVEFSNDPRFLCGVVPSANVVATAAEMSRFYQLLLNGGELDGVRIFEPRTVRRALVEHSYLEFDLTLLLPIRYGAGFMLGGKWFSPYGPDTQYAFGHLGLTNILTWADPERRLAAAILTNGKPLVYPEIYYGFQLLREIGRTFAKNRVRPASFFCPPRRREPERVAPRVGDEPLRRAGGGA
ncbi:MAG: hydrolase [Candidatus Binatia bacterium]|nr:MAG: hydrolase [Candidatus Binatia bacterium]